MAKVCGGCPDRFEGCGQIGEIKAQTLREIGLWLESRLKEDISNFTQGFITLGEIEMLKKGEMPK